jgi:hypothetical protein
LIPNDLTRLCSTLGDISDLVLIYKLKYHFKTVKSSLLPEIYKNSAFPPNYGIHILDYEIENLPVEKVIIMFNYPSNVKLNSSVFQTSSSSSRD